MTSAQCEIVSYRTDDAFDAYVLSESSLFVYADKIVLKTCGTTLLLRAIPGILAHAQRLGLALVRVKYSRASFLFPQHQPEEYQCFTREVDFLNDKLTTYDLVEAPAARVLGEEDDGHLQVGREGGEREERGRGRGRGRERGREREGERERERESVTWGHGEQRRHPTSLRMRT